ncbi:MAG: OmpH family outer membrane protein [Gammaproteobacteria bacterium]|nr:OmpH family outer membrane protein [Gammaproteobacteria bacterium]
MTVMKKLALALSTTLLIGTLATAQADPATTTAAAATSASNLTVGVIDLTVVLQHSTQAKAAGDTLKKQFKPRQQKILDAQKQLQDDQDKLKRDSSVMSASDAQALQTKISSEGRDLQQMQDDYMQDLRAAQQQAMQQVLAKIQTIVQKIATQGHYDLILQKNTVAYSSPRIDITQQVIDAMES